jgi:lysine 2,3-aminomutase
MQADHSSAVGEEPPAGYQTRSLKSFRSAGRGFWHDVADADWNDWHWQLKHRITTVGQLEKFMPALTPEELAGAKLANHKLALGITPYFFNLIDSADENCPIRRQVIPRIEETHTASWELSDPCGEDSHSPVPGLVHRYPDRVLFLVTDRCASYSATAPVRGWSATPAATTSIPNTTSRSPTSPRIPKSATCS